MKEHDLIPFVSIIIPTYNYAGYIKEAVTSVWKQSYPQDRVEIIIIDDGSTDNTSDLISEINNGSIRYYYQPNKGKAAATRWGIELAKGEYVFNLDADDYFFEDKIAKFIEIFESDNSIVHVASPAQFLVNGQIDGEEVLPEHLVGKKNNGLDVLDFFYTKRVLYGGGSTFSAKAVILKQIDIPDAVDMFIDEFLVFSILNHGASFFINQPLSIWRGHGKNYTVNVTNTKHLRMLQSSEGMLKTIESSNCSSKIKKLFALHHYTRTLKMKETIGDKNMQDIFHFMKCVFFNKYSIRQLVTYKAFNRIIPMSFLKILGK